MGFFSWMTADTGESISNRYSTRGALPCYVLCPDGKVIEEQSYEGYGEFGEHDIFALFAQWNIPEQCIGNEIIDRDAGIDYLYSGNEIKYPIKIVRYNNVRYDEVDASVDCPYQGFFYNDEENDYLDEEEDFWCSVDEDW